MKELRWNWRSIYQLRWSTDENAWEECYCGLGVLLSRNSLWCYTPEKQLRRGRHQDHSPRCWCCFSCCNWNYHPFTRYRCSYHSLRIYTQLCRDVRFVTGTGQTHQVINLKHVLQALGSTRVAALPDLHSLSGADITGSFMEKERPFDGGCLWQQMKKKSAP